MLLASGTYLNGAGRDGLGPEPRHVLLKVIGFGSDAGRRAAHPFPPLFLPSLEVALDGLPELSCGLGLRPQASVLPPEPSVLPREPPAVQQPVSHPQRPGAHRSEQGVGARLGCLGRFARKNHRAKHREKLFGIAFFRVFSRFSFSERIETARTGGSKEGKRQSADGHGGGGVRAQAHLTQIGNPSRRVLGTWSLVALACSPFCFRRGMGGVPTAIALPNTGIGLQSTTSVLAFVGGLVVPASPRPIFARLDISEKPETKEKKSNASRRWLRNPKPFFSDLCCVDFALCFGRKDLMCDASSHHPRKSHLFFFLRIACSGQLRWLAPDRDERAATTSSAAPLGSSPVCV